MDSLTGLWGMMGPYFEQGGMMGSLFVNPLMFSLSFAVMLVYLALFVWCIVDLIKSKNDAMNKLFWLFVITMVGNMKYSFIGVVLYLVFGRNKKR